MANVLILGAGICGLGAGLLLARDGHEVTVLERDDARLPETPDAAWDAWERKGVVQFRQPHNFMPGLRHLLESELPDVQDALRRAGASRFDLINPLPPFPDQSTRPDDERFWTYTARRPAGEWVFADAARRQPRLTIRSGVKVNGLVTGPSVNGRVPHVVGVRTESGETLRADVVVDAMGRLSKLPDWLEAVGARRPYEEQSDCGFTYYSRYFRGTEPQRVGPVLAAIGTISVLTLPGDNGSWSVTIFTASGDQPLKRLRHADTFTKAVRACPLQAHWVDGEPITDVLPMSGAVDRYRRFVVDGQPVATGVLAVADASSCTNPSAGRGLTVGMQHALRLRDVLRDAADDPLELVERFDAVTESEITPWYHAQRAGDRLRFEQIEALREGRAPRPPADELSTTLAALFAAMAMDPDMFRVALEYFATMTPVQELARRPAVAERLNEVKASLHRMAPPPMPGPTREQLLAIVS